MALTLLVALVVVFQPNGEIDRTLFWAALAIAKEIRESESPLTLEPEIQWAYTRDNLR